MWLIYLAAIFTKILLLPLQATTATAISGGDDGSGTTCVKEGIVCHGHEERRNIALEGVTVADQPTTVTTTTTTTRISTLGREGDRLNVKRDDIKTTAFFVWDVRATATVVERDNTLQRRVKTSLGVGVL